MFLVFCPVHDREVLLGMNRVRNLANVAEGVIALELECHDGQRIALLTGQRLGSSSAAAMPQQQRSTAQSMRVTG